MHFHCPDLAKVEFQIQRNGPCRLMYRDCPVYGEATEREKIQEKVCKVAVWCYGIGDLEDAE